jgi:hypothetical protein
MDRIESGSPRELGERLTGPRREAAACETWRVTVEAALNRMVSLGMELIWFWHLLLVLYS